MRRVKLIRIVKGFKAYEFSAQVGLHPNLWHEIEVGVRQPSERVAQKAAELLGVAEGELFAFVDQNEVLSGS